MSPTVLGRRWQGRWRLGGRVLSDLLQAVREPLSSTHLCVFFYQSLRPSSALKLLANDTFWLSHAPFTPGSLFPGAGTTRIATVAHFRLVAASPTSTSELILLNAHLDHVSDDQRRLGAAMLLHRARYEAHAKPGVPLFVTGDFNRCAAAPPAIYLPPPLTERGGSSAIGDDEGAYAVLTGTQAAPSVPDDFARRFPLPPRGDSQLVMVDLRVAAPRLHVGGEWATFTGFEKRKKDEMCIDFVFGGSDGRWCVVGTLFFFSC